MWVTNFWGKGEGRNVELLSFPVFGWGQCLRGSRGFGYGVGCEKKMSGGGCGSSGGLGRKGRRNGRGVQEGVARDVEWGVCGHGCVIFGERESWENPRTGGL